MDKERLGKQIETTGTVLLVLGIVAVLIYGFMTIYKLGDTSRGCLIIGIGLISSWLSTLVIRGFGRLVENSEKSAELMQYIASQKKDE